MRSAFDPPANRDDAIDQLRYRSRDIGGNGVISVTCQKQEGSSVEQNCWNSLTCKAVAIKVEPLPPPNIAAAQALMPAQSVGQGKKRETQDIDILRSQDVEQLQAGVVKITAKSSGETPKLGTGFIVRLDKDAAYIVTAAHVVAGDPQPKVEFFTKRNLPVLTEVLGLEGDDEVRGLALLVVRGTENLPKGITALSFAAAARLSGGEDILVIGFPRNAGPWALIKGNISSRQGRDMYFSPSVDSGHSGGPVLYGGKVVAMVGAGSQSVGRGVTARSVQDYIEGFEIMSK